MATEKHNKTSKAQLKASNKYRRKNPEAFKRVDYKSKAKMFMINYADNEEVLNFLSFYANENLENKKKIKEFFKELLDLYLDEFSDKDDLIYLVQKFNEKYRDEKKLDLASIL